VNFVQATADGSLDVLTYEAGVEDVTPACGTGSTAAAYVCARSGRTSFPVRVRLLGGELVIDARGDSTTMRGPAEYMRPCALDVSHLRAGVEPPTEMAGPVVLAGGTMRCEEGRA
jgi:diaminopimelate epimerase